MNDLQRALTETHSISIRLAVWAAMAAVSLLVSS